MVDLKRLSIRHWVLFGVLCSSVPLAGGCRTAPAGSDQAMTKAFDQKTFDINNVPANQRERVKAIMESQKAQKR